MNKTNHIICAAALAATALISGCDDDFTRPPVILPPVIEVDTTISLSDYKSLAWNTITSGPQQVGFLENGDSIIFTGRVCSSDESGNIYKNIIIQAKDADGEQVALTFSVNRYDIYELFPFGQEVAVYATGLSVGPYRNLLQFGAISGDQMTFMDESEFTTHVFRNGSALPDPTKVDTTLATIPEVVAAKADTQSLCKWQSRLVKFENVHWKEAGQQYAGSTTVNRNIVDADGNTLIVRNSSYADFSDQLMPYGTGTVVGILSYFSNDWQLTLIDETSCIGFDGEAPDTPVAPGAEGEGTAASPYNVAKALEIAGALDANGKVENVYVKGIVATVSEIDTSYGNATYSIADAANGETLGVYRGYWLNGDKFTSSDQLVAGAEVVVCGTLVNYYGNTRQFTTGSKIVSYNGQTGGGATEDTKPVEGTIYSALGENETELSAGWTIENIELGTAQYAWQWKEYLGNYYLNASTFVNNVAVPSEAYCISPVVDLTGVKTSAVSFDHAAKFQTTLTSLCGVVAREEGATTWTELTIPTWPAAGSWTFVNSGNIDLSAFDGKKVQVAFRYKASADGADTWEIKNFVITGNK